MATTIKVFGAAVFIFMGVSLTLATTESLRARQKSLNYLWSQRDNDTGFFPYGEVASALLAVTSSVVQVNGGLPTDRHDSQRVSILHNLERMHVDFLSELEASDGRLEDVDTTLLAQVVGVLQLTCTHDLRNYFGHDLIHEVRSRLKKIGAASGPKPVTYPALALVLCNSKEKLGFDLVHHMDGKEFEAGQSCPFCVERAALNSLALKCVQEKRKDNPRGQRRLGELVARNLAYIYSMQESDGSFGTVYATALALHADVARIGKPKGKSMDKEAARQRLVEWQHPDGSYGASIAITAIVVPTLESKTVDQVQHIKCNKPPKNVGDQLLVPFEIVDRVHSKQKIAGRLPATRGQTLLEALEAHQVRNPHTFSLTTEETPLGVKISGFNTLNNEDALRYKWYVDVSQSKSQDHHLTFIDDVLIDAYAHYKFIYQ